MKKIQILTLSVALLLPILAAGQLVAQEITPMQAFMRQKLTYSQSIIEGLSLERQEMVLTNAAKLMYMTKSNSWMELRVPGYLEQTRKFQDDVLELGDEARARSNPGMLKAYVKVTGGCIECHQAYRPTQATNMLAALKNLERTQRPAATGTLVPAKPGK
jgi:cytochrome c556